jgi:hypothetical protein
MPLNQFNIHMKGAPSPNLFFLLFRSQLPQVRLDAHAHSEYRPHILTHSGQSSKLFTQVRLQGNVTFTVSVSHLHLQLKCLMSGWACQPILDSPPHSRTPKTSATPPLQPPQRNQRNWDNEPNMLVRSTHTTRPHFAFTSRLSARRAQSQIACAEQSQRRCTLACDHKPAAPQPKQAVRSNVHTTPSRSKNHTKNETPSQLSIRVDPQHLPGRYLSQQRRSCSASQ